jgi:methionine biosynthesis protein MetW
MVDKLKKELARRPDLVIIADMIPPEVRVLDLGCGNGTFIKLLKEEKNVRGLGIEIDQQKIMESIATGISVIHGDLNHKMDFADDHSFDYVVLSRTLQEVNRPDKLIKEIVRVGKKAIVSFINFGYIRNRSQLFFTGRMPRTKNLPYHWYSTPNIHLATLADFREMCKSLNIKILREIPIGRKNSFLAGIMPNLFASTCVFEITKD